MPLFHKISQTSLYLLVFLIPLWFLPFTQNILDHQKQTLLVVLTFFWFIAFLAGVMKQGEFILRMNWFYILMFLLLAMVGISTIFSLWSYGSFWGLPLDAADNFLSVFAFVLLCIAISQSMERPSRLFLLLSLLVGSVTLAILFAFLQSKGIFLLPFSFSHISLFNTLGTPNSIALLSVILIPLTFVLASSGKLLLRASFGALVLALFGVAALINFFDAWVVLVGELGIFLVLGIWSSGKATNLSSMFLPMAMIVAALFFLFIRSFSLPGSPVLPPEVSPDYRGEWKLAEGVMREGLFSLAFGSGPGTFVFDYAKFHSSSSNQTIFWGTRFSEGAAEMLDWMVTKGVGGVLALGGLIGGAFILALRNLVRKLKEDGGSQEEALSRKLTLGVGASFVGIVIAQFLYPFHFTLWFVFWVLLGSLVALTVQRTHTLSFRSSAPLISLGFSFALLVLLVSGVGLLIIGGQKYAAEIEYSQGVQQWRIGNTEDAIGKVEQASRWNPSMDLYWRDLSQLYLVRANRIAADEKLSQEERRRQMGFTITRAIGATRKAIELSSANVANWNVQGFVYRNLIGIEGADQLAIKAYTEAIQREPSSPFAWGELGRVYILQAQRIQGKELESQRMQAWENALTNLKKAIELKEDYSPAHYLIAVVYEQQGKIQEAIAKLEETRARTPDDIGVAFQLGSLYYRKNQLEKAQQEFERAKRVNPDYSNARYMLGLVYDRQGKRTEAIGEFRAVAKLNPRNEEVKKILHNLSEGLPALEGIVPSQPPLQETPPEISKEQSIEE